MFPILPSPVPLLLNPALNPGFKLGGAPKPPKEPRSLWRRFLDWLDGVE